MPADPLEDPLVQLLDLEGPARTRALEALCAAFPDRARELRARVALLDRLDPLDPIHPLDPGPHRADAERPHRTAGGLRPDPPPS